MKKLGIGLILVLMSSVLVSRLGFREERISFAPHWRLGQSWKVRVASAQANEETQGDPYRVWTFRVTEKTVIDDHTFYTIKVSPSRKRTGPIFVLRFMGPDTFLTGLSMYKNKKFVREERSTASAFFLSPAEAREIPLDLSIAPVFNLSGRQKNEDLTLVKKATLLWGVSPVNQSTEFSQRILGDRVVRTLKILISADSNGRQTENLQFWESGKPWWTAAKRTLDGQVLSEGVLVDGAGSRF